MPKSKVTSHISINLLKPQSNPQKLPLMFLHWLLFAGRYIFVIVEAAVLIAFAARFKLDADIAAKKEAIDEQIPYINSLKPYELLVRQTQFKLSTISTTKNASSDWAVLLKKVADQVPQTSKLVDLKIENKSGTTKITIVAETKIPTDITNLEIGLKEDESFSGVVITSIGQEEESIKYTIEATAKLIKSESI